MKSAAWRAGWLARARHSPSPNCAPRSAGVAVELVVVHAISLPPGRYGGDAIEALFANRLDWGADPYFETIRGLRVSAHFLIRRAGELVQFVSADDCAWHAGVSRWRERDACNDFSIGIELEGLDGATFEAVQYRVLASLIDDIAARYPIEAVTGHEDIAPGRKRDPGPGFEWQGLRALLSRRDLQVEGGGGVASGHEFTG